MAAGADTLAEIVDRVYADVDPALRAATEASVRAQVRYLVDRGDVPVEVLAD